ncbi:hypothetical protein SANA_07500 [Gottschalkiaceae bacterium SANA]|nr:hypothetical protein SANA_07500 [Gottschalkiaceae bacterium SANA]
MKLNQKSIAILVVVILFGGVFVSDTLGLWKTESSKVPVKIQTGEFVGEADPADIRGSYTLSDIANAFPISVEVLAEAFFIEENAAEFQLKRLEETYASEDDFELGTSSVRLFVARYTGLPYERTGEEALFPHTIDFLVKEGKLTLEEAEQIPIMESEIPIVYENENTVEEEHVEPLVKGNTTVADLFGLGLSEEEIVSVIGDYDSKGDLVRDVCNSNEVAFSKAKLTLQDLVEK